MITIVIFCLVELWPIWYVLDGSFIDIFFREEVLIDSKGINVPLLNSYGEEENDEVEMYSKAFSLTQMSSENLMSHTKASSYKNPEG